ncbi:phasin family protein [Pararhodospirillum oryzae]|uniref:Phasin domain-containing protein n=1 Tax=Pararhodospirillum oryzae TaxID=478448 RepID=A0A512HAU0_9PROT|nr:phasin family protein [Pararhodospirillum oryzae]GEO82577.1 hypothetical protein ROR02_27080 [Pararhodospirillum oryzae]
MTTPRKASSKASGRGVSAKPEAASTVETAVDPAPAPAVSSSGEEPAPGTPVPEAVTTEAVTTEAVATEAVATEAVATEVVAVGEPAPGVASPVEAAPAPEPLPLSSGAPVLEAARLLPDAFDALETSAAVLMDAGTRVQACCLTYLEHLGEETASLNRDLWACTDPAAAVSVQMEALGRMADRTWRTGVDLLAVASGTWEEAMKPVVASSSRWSQAALEGRPGIARP